MNSQDTPIFLQAGVDTAINQITCPRGRSRPRRSTSGSRPTPRAVNVYNYAISRGSCDEFADAGADGIEGADSASIQAIRDNFGFDCNGVRMPATARSHLLARAAS